MMNVTIWQIRKKDEKQAKPKSPNAKSKPSDELQGKYNSANAKVRKWRIQVIKCRIKNIRWRICRTQFGWCRIRTIIQGTRGMQFSCHQNSIIAWQASKTIRRGTNKIKLSRSRIRTIMLEKSRIQDTRCRRIIILAKSGVQCSWYKKRVSHEGQSEWKLLNAWPRTSDEEQAEHNSADAK